MKIFLYMVNVLLYRISVCIKAARSYCSFRKWMDDMQVHILFHIISVLSGQWQGDNERLCAMAPGNLLTTKKQMTNYSSANF